MEAAARHIELDPKTVKAIDKAALKAEFGRTIYDALKRLPIDRTAVKKGHNYMTVALDYDTGRVVWMGEGRQAAAIEKFFEAMPTEDDRGAARLHIETRMG